MNWIEALKEQVKIMESLGADEWSMASAGNSALILGEENTAGKDVLALVNAPSDTNAALDALQIAEFFVRSTRNIRSLIERYEKISAVLEKLPHEQS